MRVPLKWLAEYVDIVVPVEELAHVLTMSGTEVSGVDRLGDAVLHLEVTPNRPDCLGVLGIAREVAALTGQPLRLPDLAYPEAGPDVADQAQVEIQAPDLCHRYTASIVESIRVGPSPPWLRARLTSAGVRPINTIVDVTNYVMLEYGQPMHAFDYETLLGRRIEVRRARSGEALKTLDGTVRSLPSDLLVIADAARPVALAGIMGGAESEVTERTTSVLLESANFDRVSVRRGSRLLRLRTESSARFDKGLPPAIAAYALRRATKLLVELCGGRASRGILDVYPNPPPPIEVRLTSAELRRILGIELTPAQTAGVLGKLGFHCREEGQALLVTPPAHRSDIRIPADLAEEVARLIGYDRIPTTTMSGVIPSHPPQPLTDLIERVKDLLAGSGLQEVISYSLVGRRLLGRTNYGEGSGVPSPLVLANPLTPDQEILRTSLLPSLLECVVKNLRPGEGGVRLFEVGRVYLPRQDDLPQEREMLGLAMAGSRWFRRWGSVDAELEFTDLKGVVEELFDRLHVEGASFERSSGQGFFHPGRTALIGWRGLRLGAIGELHPAVARNFELGGPAFLAELDIEVLLGAVEVDSFRVALPPRFPEMRRDLAVVVEEDVAVAQLLDIIRQAGGPLLVSAELFDLFRGRGVPSGRKSCAFALVFRSPERTLIDGEVAELEARIIEQLERLTGARLRG